MTTLIEEASSLKKDLDLIQNLGDGFIGLGKDVLEASEVVRQGLQEIRDVLEAICMKMR